MGGSGSRSFADNEAVVKVRYTGGFTSPVSLATRLPIVSVYGDGRVITEGPVLTIYPGRALPNVLVEKISKEDVSRLAARAIAAGVGNAGDLGEPTIADAATTRFTVLTSDGAKTTEVYALNEAGPDQTVLSGKQQAARKKLHDLLAALTDLPATLGAGAIDKAQPFAATELVAVASTWADPETRVGPNIPEVQWPGPALPGEQLGEELGCVAMSGEQMAVVLAAAATATTITPWVSAGSRWNVSFRPLLPDETGCAAVRVR